jgi:hypothetical protein
MISLDLAGESGLSPGKAVCGSLSLETYFSSTLLLAYAYSFCIFSCIAYSYSKIFSYSISAISSSTLTKVFMLNTVG